MRKPQIYSIVDRPLKCAALSIFYSLRVNRYVLEVDDWPAYALNKSCELFHSIYTVLIFLVVGPKRDRNIDAV